MLLPVPTKICPSFEQKSMDIGAFSIPISTVVIFFPSIFERPMSVPT